MLAKVVQPSAAAVLESLPAAPDNPDGFSESRLIVDCNTHLLSLVGGDWHRPPLVAPNWADAELLASYRHWRSALQSYALSELWIDKDPRLCITFPAYLHLLLRRPPLAAVLREPLAVAASLYARDGFAIEAGLSLWFLYNHHLASFLQSDDLLLTYSSLIELDSGRLSPSVIEAVAKFLEKLQIPGSSLELLEINLGAVVRPELNRAQHAFDINSLDSADGSLLVCCQSAYEAVASLSDTERITSFRQVFDALPRSVLLALQRHGHLAQPCSQELVLHNDSLRRQLQESRENIAACEVRVRAIESSTSWRIMAPLRRIKDLTSRLGT